MTMLPPRVWPAIEIDTPVAATRKPGFRVTLSGTVIGLVGRRGVEPHLEAAGDADRGDVELQVRGDLAVDAGRGEHQACR